MRCEAYLTFRLIPLEPFETLIKRVKNGLKKI